MRKLASVAAPLLLGRVAVAQYGVFALDQLEPDLLSSPTAITADGSLIGGASLDSPHQDGRAALWHAATRDGLVVGRPTAEGAARFTDLAADGASGLVETRHRASVWYHFWNDQTGFTEVPLAGGWNPDHWGAFGLSRDGHTAVGWAHVIGQGTRAVAWLDGSPVELPHAPEWSSSGASIVGPAGTIYGSVQLWSDPGTDRLVAWTGDTQRELFAFDGYWGGGAVAASADDSVVYAGAFGYDMVQHAYRWTESGGPVRLAGPEGNDYNVVHGASDDGRIAVGFTRDGDDFVYTDVGAVWVDGAPLTFSDYLSSNGLSTDGWEFISVSAISGDGTIFVGFGFDSLGDLRGFVAIVPVPSGALLLLAGAGAMGARRRR